MDARITKSRLANLISYDWLKIVAGILAAVLALCVFFTTVKTRPRDNQVFAIYGYREVTAGEGCRGLSDRLLENGIFSYDVLSVENETFGTDQYSDTALAARRSTMLGSVMFTTTNPMECTDESGNVVKDENGETVYTTVLASLVGGNELVAYDLERYLADCENYLIRFFGENWREGSLNEEEARRCFEARNGSDRRFRSQEKKEEGVLKEKERLESLRENYLAALGYLESGLISYVRTPNNEGGTSAMAFSLGGLRTLRNLYFYTENGGPVSSNICLIFFRNDYDAGKPAAEVTNDLRYEPLAFLRYVVETYA